LARATDVSCGFRTKPQDFECAELVRDILDAVGDRRGLWPMVRFAEEMLVAAAAVIEQEAGPDEACAVLKIALQCTPASD
jgi:hypothetical protein